MCQNKDKLECIFEKQNQFMNMLKDNDKLPEYPINITTKSGQRLIKETNHNLIEELMEASFCLRNKIHKFSDDNVVDFEHYKEELGDALAYFIEICILSGISCDELYDEYSRKNQIVIERLQNGY